MSFAPPRRSLLGSLATAALFAWGCSRDVQPETPTAVLAQPPSPAVKTASPPASAPASDQLDVDVKPTLSVVTADKGTEMVVRVRVRGLPLKNAKRPVINLALVVDTSGSMEGPAIEREREACSKLIDALGDGDAVSVVTFGSQPHVIVGATKIDKDSRTRAKKALSAIVAEGTTDMSGGLRFGLEQVRQLLTTDGINRIVLVGDGVPNDPASVTQLADQAKNSHIPITSLGLGADFDEQLMTSVAVRSGGTFHFVDDASKVARIFEQELSKMQRVVAHNTWVEVNPGPGVVIEDVIGIPHSAAGGRNVRFNLGELSEGQVRDTMVRVSVTGRRDGAKIELLDAIAHYSHANQGGEMTAGEFKAITASKDAGAVAEGRDPEVDHQGARLTVADNIVRAIAMARAGDVKGARALLDQTAKLALEASDRFHDAELEAKAKEVRTLRKSVASLAPPPAPPSPSPSPVAMRPTKAPAPPRPMDRDEAMGMRAIHGAAVSEIQGH